MIISLPLCPFSHPFIKNKIIQQFSLKLGKRRHKHGRLVRTENEILHNKRLSDSFKEKNFEIHYNLQFIYFLYLLVALCYCQERMPSI
jgi:hypothetical protein